MAGMLPVSAAGVPLSAARGGRRAADCSLWARRAEFMEAKIQTFLDVNLLKGDRKQLWVNPDCGLKTREWSQVRRAIDVLHFPKTLTAVPCHVWNTR